MARFRIPLSGLMMAVHLLVLMVPLSGLFFFRFYENALVQQTESELISQAAVIAAMYRHEMGIKSPISASIPTDPSEYQPILPSLDLSQSPILPRRPDAHPASKINPETMRIGEKLLPIFIEAQKTTLAGLRLIDAQGVVIAGKQEMGLYLGDVPEIADALKGQYRSVLRQRISDAPPPAIASISRGTGIRVFVALPIMADGQILGVVYMSRTPANILKYMYDSRTKIMLVGILMLAVTCLLAWVTAKGLTRPINRLARDVLSYEKGGKMPPKPSRSWIGDIDILGNHFYKMMETTRMRADYVRSFAMNVSHAVKTPLTAILGAAELLLEHRTEMTPDRQKRFLENIIADSNRLNRLASRLIQLARAEHVSGSDEHCDLVAMLTALRQHYGQQGLVIEIISPSNLYPAIGQDHFDSIITNLLDNAQQHGARHVTITARIGHEDISIQIANDGTPIAQTDRGKIFDAFFTTRPNSGGSGLGLGIVQSLLHAHGGTITLLDTVQTCFEIRVRTH